MIGRILHKKLIGSFLNNTARKYKHIVIDEGQDLSPVSVESLVHAIPEDGTLTYFW